MKRQYIIGLMTVILLAGCADKKDAVPDIPPSDLYSQAHMELQTGDWASSIKKLEALDSRYPFGPYSDQVQLDLIYAYYKNGDYALTSATIARFTRLNPAHARTDWVLYMSGLTNMAQDSNFMHTLFGIDRSDRDPEPVKAAFVDFKRLLERYPNSDYAADARIRLLALKNRLAEYDLASADFYLRREAYIAAINRCQEIQKTYPDTKAAHDSLKIQLKAYKAINLEDGVNKTQELITLNKEK
ncbi:MULTISPECIES: outer membrane protein assembly factor BamD [Vibrio]|uniref:Outer membrane protein assembly factor BamD n=1 Tax=Vibrio algicola TaxID=2662262 RepID=A0A5Q0TH61_9VIBR|nr:MULTISPECIES: outer membrane protein assembly factor BamD [Vibrio]MBD1575378.1 outer membrane protein assembly factor BamD [Vibrio sp. S11_S32]